MEMHAQRRCAFAPPAEPLRASVTRWWLWLTVAGSGIVFVEPAPSDILGAGLLAFAFAAGLRVPRHLVLPALLLGLFVVGNLLGSMLSPEPAASLLPFSIRLYLLLGWWLVPACLLHEQPQRVSAAIWNAYLLAAVLTALAGTLAFFGALPDDGRLVEQGRVRAFFKDPNVYGPFLVAPILYLLHRAESAGTWTSLAQLALAGILGLGLMLGFSRGSWLNFVVSLCIYLGLRLASPRTRREKRRMLFAGAGMLVVCAGIVAAALALEPVREMLDVRAKLAQDYDVQSAVGGTKSRFDVQAETLWLALRRPAGIGAGQSEMDYNQGKAPHNLFLHTLVEAGWIGGLAFHAFLLLTLVQASRVLFANDSLQGRYQVVFASVIGTLLQSLFVDSTHWRHVYLLLALLWGPLHLLRIRHAAAAPRTIG